VLETATERQCGVLKVERASGKHPPKLLGVVRTRALPRPNIGDACPAGRGVKIKSVNLSEGGGNY